MTLCFEVKLPPASLARKPRGTDGPPKLLRSHDTLSQGARSQGGRRSRTEHEQMAGHATQANITGMLIPMRLRQSGNFSVPTSPTNVSRKCRLVAASSSALRHGSRDRRK